MTPAKIVIEKRLRDLIPPLSRMERAGLEAEIVAEGRARDPLIRWKGRYILIDGHNRFEICSKHGLAFTVEDKEFSDETEVRIWMLTHQASRRNLTDDQRAILGARLGKEIAEKVKRERASKAGKAGGIGRPKKNSLAVTATAKLKKQRTPRAEEQAAGIFDVSERRIRVAWKVGSKRLQDKVLAKEISLLDARDLAAASDSEADGIIREARRKSKPVKAIVKARNKAAAVASINSFAFPAGKFYVIAADPPWKYESRADDPSHRAANPYPAMTEEELKDWRVDGRHVGDLAHVDCVLWLWTTNAFIVQAHRVAEAWGFSVKTILTWVKDRMGTGDWLRGQTEHCLLCAKGKPVINLTNQTTVLHGPLREHSRKPDEFHALVEAMCPGKKCEIFGRQQRKGWTVIGAEADKFASAAQAARADERRVNVG